YFKLGHIRLVMIWFNDTKLKILIETAKEALSDIRAVYIKETKENRSSGIRSRPHTHPCRHATKQKHAATCIFPPEQNQRSKLKPIFAPD
ncbi:hypothetical protein, partial [Bacteroides heparinolyticus]